MLSPSTDRLHMTLPLASILIKRAESLVEGKLFVKAHTTYVPSDSYMTLFVYSSSLPAMLHAHCVWPLDHQYISVPINLSGACQNETTITSLRHCSPEVICTRSVVHCKGEEGERAKWTQFALIPKSSLLGQQTQGSD